MILNFTYGIDARSIHDPFLALVDKAMEIVSLATIPGRFLVDTIPACMFHGPLPNLYRSSTRSEIRSCVVPWCRFQTNGARMEKGCSNDRWAVSAC